jgi:hypothetical protein
MKRDYFLLNRATTARMKDLIQAKTAIHDIDEWAEYEAQLDKAIESCTGEDQAANGCQRWTRRSEERRIARTWDPAPSVARQLSSDRGSWRWPAGS